MIKRTFNTQVPDKTITFYTRVHDIKRSFNTQVHDKTNI